MGFPWHKVAQLNGIVQYGYVGIYRMTARNTRKTFMYVPSQRTDSSHIRPDCQKILLCEDQIFTMGEVEGDIMECFKYCYSYPDNPDRRIRSGVYAGQKGAVVCIQLPKKLKLNSVSSSAFSVRRGFDIENPKPPLSQYGQVQICLGEKVSYRNYRIVNLEIDESKFCTHSNIKVEQGIAEGNLIWIEIGPYTEIPYITFGMKWNNANAMMDRLSDTPKRRPLRQMMCSEKGIVTIKSVNTWYEQNPFETCIHKCSIDKMLYPEGIRFEPVFGHPSLEYGAYLDTNLERSLHAKTMAIIKLADWPKAFNGKPDYIVNIAREFVYRYGRNQNIDKRKRPVDIDTIFNHPWRPPHKNHIKVGLGLARGIHIDNIFGSDPFVFAKAQNLLYTEMKKIDENFWVGLSIKPDRNMLYFATQHMRTTIKKQCFDYVNLKITSYKELWDVYSVLGFMHTYLDGIPVFIELDFNFDWREYPALLYICSQWNVSKVILNGMEEIISRLGIGQQYIDLTKWIGISKDFMTTKIHIFDDTIHAIGISETTRKKYHVLGRGIGVGKKRIKYNNQVLDMPIICEGAHHPNGYNREEDNKSEVV